MNEKDCVKAILSVSLVVVGLGLAAYFGGGIGVIAALMYGGGSRTAAELSKKLNPVSSHLVPSQN
jgi:hypothetical protein